MSKTKYSPSHFKEHTQGRSIQKMSLPAEVVLPLLQHTGAPCQAKVSLKDKVKTGQLIADSEKYISAPIHASVCGEVKAIEKRPHPVLGEYQAIVISSDGQDSPDAAIKERESPDFLSADAIRRIVRNCGIVGLGGAAFPAHVKLNPPQEKKIDTFILNAAECEPYLTADHRLMLERPQEILGGMKIVMKTLGVTSGIVAIEDNKPDVIRIYKELVDGKSIKAVSLKSFYPQGAEKQMIKTILGREVPPGGLPFDVGVVVNNVATCLAIYEAVYMNKPLYERVITIAGTIVKNPANLLVRIGTKIGDIIEFCGGLTEEPAKIILGGPMMGIAQYSLDAPVIKGTSGIIVFSKKETAPRPSHPCIRCGRCIQVCPMGLNPSQIAKAIEKGRFDLAEEYNVMDCVECGACSYICPGNSNIVSLVKLAKHIIKTGSGANRRTVP
ncbi:MAG: electron transport complex subunit RsxC [Candidatus Omnitrophica bacterium]|nr:electron transport complex subunit RsxC [Candidatus Omnitrophota bacterium]